MPEIEVADVEAIIRFSGRYAALSNFKMHDGWSVEHRYQADKTLDIHWRARILAADKPGEAKKLGRQAPMREDWPLRKEAHMYGHLCDKFTIRSMRRQLLDTKEALLVEGNSWHDNEWGVCFCPTCPGRGENKLGRLLMTLREQIR